jgi:hypothetical protein
MTDDERADWLARAIDDIIRGAEPSDSPPALSEIEAESLLQAARLRLESGRSAQETAADHESAVWERLMARLERHGAPTEEPAPPDAHSDDELRQVIGLRMHLAHEALQIAEQHREEVWERVRSRIGGEGVAISYGEIAQHAAGPTQVRIHQRRRRADLSTAAEATPTAERGPLPRIGLLHVAGAALIVAVATAIAAIQLT